MKFSSLFSGAGGLDLGLEQVRGRLGDLAHALLHVLYFCRYFICIEMYWTPAHGVSR